MVIKTRTVLRNGMMEMIQVDIPEQTDSVKKVDEAAVAKEEAKKVEAAEKAKKDKANAKKRAQRAKAKAKKEKEIEL